jgi:site-specific DNA-methyltransferase (adenine-specific)
MTNKLILGNCFKELEKIDDLSVDAIITDPPYFTTNLKFDKVKFEWAELWIELKRVIKPNGVILVFGQMRSAIDVILSNQKWFRYDIIWEKTMPTGFFDANFKPLRSHEMILVFSKTLKNTTYNPQMGTGIAYNKINRSGSAAHYSGGTPRISTINNGDRYPRDVIKFSNGNYQSPHPTAKPLELIKYLVNTYSNEGDLILDPFGGSGTTAIACLETNRNYLVMEKDEEYHAIAEQRIVEWHNKKLENTGTHVLPPEIPRIMNRSNQLCLFGR